MLLDPTQEASKLWNVLPAMPGSPLCIRALPPSGCNDYLPVANCPSSEHLAQLAV